MWLEEDNTKKENMVCCYRYVNLFFELGVFYLSARQLTT